jgi:hypothetical protein
MSSWIANRLAYLDTKFTEECMPLSIDENIIERTFFIAYPDSNKGLLNLKFSCHQVNNIKIFNSQGILYYQASNIKQPDHTIDISSYANGVYIISVDIDNSILTKKMILEN